MIYPAYGRTPCSQAFHSMFANQLYNYFQPIMPFYGNRPGVSGILTENLRPALQSELTPAKEISAQEIKNENQVPPVVQPEIPIHVKEEPKPAQQIQGKEPEGTKEQGQATGTLEHLKGPGKIFKQKIYRFRCTL